MSEINPVFELVCKIKTIRDYQRCATHYKYFPKFEKGDFAIHAFELDALEIKQISANFPIMCINDINTVLEYENNHRDQNNEHRYTFFWRRSSGDDIERADTSKFSLPLFDGTNYDEVEFNADMLVVNSLPVVLCTLLKEYSKETNTIYLGRFTYDDVPTINNLLDEAIEWINKSTQAS
ncbi:hypothetical protein ENKO_068 [Klebsiella phage fENko-Kae01]|uniref:hypothetical protein n=1 Tax=Salmonella enterica TaxID=28901 RepID=UPI002B2F7880|nr:hypothetical protein [Klebsiella phage fENko-Kae01]